MARSSSRRSTISPVPIPSSVQRADAGTQTPAETCSCAICPGCCQSLEMLHVARTIYNLFHALRECPMGHHPWRPRAPTERRDDEKMVSDEALEQLQEEDEYEDLGEGQFEGASVGEDEDQEAEELEEEWEGEEGEEEDEEECEEGEEDEDEGEEEEDYDEYYDSYERYRYYPGVPPVKCKIMQATTTPSRSRSDTVRGHGRRSLAK